VNCLKAKTGKDLEFSCGNDESGAKAVVESLGDKIQQTHVVLEATSNMHLRVVRALQEAGASVQVLNPKQARSLAQGLGILDKDDQVDARVLARAAQVLSVKNTELRNGTHEELRNMSRLITLLTRVNAENKKRLCSLEPSSKTYALLKGVVKALKEQILVVKKEWAKLLEEDEEIKRRYKQAMSVGDVGQETARLLACELPARLEEFCNKQLCAYSAVVPRRNRSGTMQKPDKVGKAGNSHLRTGLFMSATRTVFTSKTNEEFYLKLRAKGRTHKQAMIAVIHRLLRQIVAVLKRNSPWTKQPPERKTETAVSAVAT